MRDADRPILVRYGPPVASDAGRPIAAEGVAAHPTAGGPSRVRLADRLADRLAHPGALGRAAYLWLATRLLLFVCTLCAAIVVAVQHHQAPDLTPHALLALWLRFDATAYLHIVDWGYAFPNQAAFFPLYPLLIAAVRLILGPSHELLGAMLISNLGTLAAFVGLAKLAVDEGHDARETRGAVLALAAYPLAFFLGAAYTEGPFIALAVWGLWAMRRGHWYRAAACVFLAALARPTGLILVAPLLCEFGRQHDWWRAWGRAPERPRGRAAFQGVALQGGAALAAGPLGIGLFALYCAARYGDPLAWLHAQSAYWGRSVEPIWQAVHDTAVYFFGLPLLGLKQDKQLVDVVPLVVVLVMTIALARRQPLAFTLYLAGLLYLVISSPYIIDAPNQHHAVFLSAGRYMLPAVPLYLAAGRGAARSPRAGGLILAACVVVQMALAVYFLTGGWVD